MSGVGRARIGIVGADAPRQVLLASGAEPVRLFGSWSGEVSRQARDLLGASDAVALRLLDQILAGTHGDLAGLVVCNDSAADLRLFYVLRILADRGQLAFPVVLLDAPRGRGEPRERFVAGGYAKIAEFCSSLTGSRVDASALVVAAGRERRLGEALSELRDRRASRRCTGVAALDAYRAAATLPPEEAVTAVAGANHPPGRGSFPVVVTGSSHPDASAYAAVEEAGLFVVAEDHGAGDAAWLGATAEGATADEVYADLARQHALRPPLAARSRSRERADALAAAVARVDARGVLALAREADDAPAWDLAAQRKAMRLVGVPFEERVRISPQHGERTVEEAAATLRARIQEGTS